MVISHKLIHIWSHIFFLLIITLSLAKKKIKHGHLRKAVKNKPCQFKVQTVSAKKERLGGYKALKYDSIKSTICNASFKGRFLYKQMLAGLPASELILFILFMSGGLLTCY